MLERSFRAIVLMVGIFLFISGCPPFDDGDSGSSGDDGDTPEQCIDQDGDGFGISCQEGPDCDDEDSEHWLDCETCKDGDGDGWYVDCDCYLSLDGPDCNDSDGEHWSDLETCGDLDGDGWFAGCDTYISLAGPDCDDSDPVFWSMCDCGCPDPIGCACTAEVMPVCVISRWGGYCSESNSCWAWLNCEQIVCRFIDEECLLEYPGCKAPCW